MGIGRRLRWLLRAAALYAMLCIALTAGSMLLTQDCATVQETYDIAVVLGGGPDSHRRVQMAETGRIHAGVDLYQRGKAARLHIAGGAGLRTVSDRHQLATLARVAGVPDDAMTLEMRSLSTLQNAIFSRPALPADARLIVVTEAFHAWRAKVSFAIAGRPAAVCASDAAGRSPRARLLLSAREAAAWAVNIPRGVFWVMARALGVEAYIPELITA